MSKQLRPPDAWWNYSDQDVGITQVVVLRYKAKATHVGVFLVDQLCCGVKNAFFAMLDGARLEEFREKFDGYEPVEVGCAERFVNEAIQFAARFGFAPHPDYRRAASIFAEIPVCGHQHEFKFGQYGKPHFMAGPGDSDQYVNLVLARLSRLCGDGNYFYTVPGHLDHLEEPGEDN